MAKSTSAAVHPASAQAFRNGRPTVYRGITMRSRLEARVAALLDRQGFNWVYETTAFKGADGTEYLPDFRIPLDGKRDVFIEVKPPLDETEREAVYKQMRVIRESLPQARLWLLRLDLLEVGGYSIDIDDLPIEMDPNLWETV